MFEELSLAAITGLTVFSWIGILFIGLFLRWLWCWIDDKPFDANNPILVLLDTGTHRNTNKRRFLEIMNKPYGQRTGSEDYIVENITGERAPKQCNKVEALRLWKSSGVKEEDISNNDLSAIAILSIIVSAWIPPLIATVLTFPLLSVTIISIIPGLYLIRAGRRTQKALKAHMEDKNAHN